MNVLHVISSGGMYGAEAVILNLSRALNEMGHCSQLGIFLNEKNPNLQLHDVALSENIQSSLISCRSQLDWKVVGRLRSLVQETSATVVHAHGYKADLYSYAALRNIGIPLVSTCHGWIAEGAATAVYGAADRWALRKFDAIVAVSEKVRQRLLHADISANKICLIENGIDEKPFEHATASLRSELYPALQQAVIVGLVGRLSPEKGIDIFIQAAARILRQFPSTQFVVVGDGPDRDKLQALIDELQVANNVHLLGRRTDMPSIYRSLDIMVSSSRTEGMPMAILEGMASQRAIIATAVGEIPALITDGLTGRLIAPENVDALSAAIGDLLRNPAERLRLGAEAAQRIRTSYSAKKMATEYLSVYAKINDQAC